MEKELQIYEPTGKFRDGIEIYAPEGEMIKTTRTKIAPYLSSENEKTDTKEPSISINGKEIVITTTKRNGHNRIIKLSSYQEGLSYFREHNPKEKIEITKNNYNKITGRIGDTITIFETNNPQNSKEITVT